MAGRNPVVGGQSLEDFLVKNNLFVLSAQLSESRLQSLSDGPEMAGHAENPVGVLALTLLAYFNAGHRGSLKKEVLNHLRDEAALLGFGGLADNGGEIKLAFRQSLQGGIRDAPEVLGVHLLDDALLDQLFGHLVVRVHVAQHLFELIRRKYLAQHIEYLAGAFGIEVLFDLRDALKKLVEHPALAGIRRDEIEDEAVLFLAVTVDAAHALFKSNRVPGDVVVDHQPAELRLMPSPAASVATST